MAVLLASTSASQSPCLGLTNPDFESYASDPATTSGWSASQDAWASWFQPTGWTTSGALYVYDDTIWYHNGNSYPSAAQGGPFHRCTGAWCMNPATSGSGSMRGNYVVSLSSQSSSWVEQTIDMPSDAATHGFSVWFSAARRGSPYTGESGSGVKVTARAAGTPHSSTSAESYGWNSGECATTLTALVESVQSKQNFGGWFYLNSPHDSEDNKFYRGIDQWPHGAEHYTTCGTNYGDGAHGHQSGQGNCGSQYVGHVAKVPAGDAARLMAGGGQVTIRIAHHLAHPNNQPLILDDVCPRVGATYPTSVPMPSVSPDVSMCYPPSAPPPSSDGTPADFECVSGTGACGDPLIGRRQTADLTSNVRLSSNCKRDQFPTVSRVGEIAAAVLGGAYVPDAQLTPCELSL
jgi:hypothetical protein